MTPTNIGSEIYRLVAKLYPIPRSITGAGTRQSLQILRDIIPIEIDEVPSGTIVFDWVIPKEWEIRDAFILDEQGNKIVDFGSNNLHVVGYSEPVDTWVSLSELQQHLYSLERQPEAIPYVTSYYRERWGFCISHKERSKLKEGRYHVFIDSQLKVGSLTYGEYIIPGEESKEVLFSSYICHPSMANDNLSGPAVLVYLAKWIASRPRRYTYRIVLVPETIGSLTYLSRNLETMQTNTVAGFNVTCVGDERAYSYMPSRKGDSLADRIALNVLNFRHPDFIRYSFLDRGSDERQYCSPGIDLPVVGIMRSKYGTYPEYHTSLDDLSLVTPTGLQTSYELLTDCVEAIENNYIYQVTCRGEPQLGKRGLYPTLSQKGSVDFTTRRMMNILAYADGSNDLIDLSNVTESPMWELYPLVENLEAAGLLVNKQQIESGAVTGRLLLVGR